MNAQIWFSMSLFEQLSNIDGEVKRLVDSHERMLAGVSTDDHAMDYIRNIMHLVELTFDDPKNASKKVAEKELIDEISEIIKYLNGEYPPQYITDYWNQFTCAIS
ncbi:MAG: hypothetical protein K6F86_12360 [Lachnospiraceae bacterium]|nr:hypothetical protein [Lachnospiraceae bacterium]